MSRDDIEDLVHRYSDAVVHRDGQQWASTWAPLGDAAIDAYCAALPAGADAAAEAKGAARDFRASLGFAA